MGGAPRRNRLQLDTLGSSRGCVARKIQRLLQASFSRNQIKCGLMLVREISWSTLPVKQAHGSTVSTHKLHPVMGTEMIAWRSVLHMLNRLNVIERLRRKRPQKMSGKQAYFRALMLEVKTVSRSGPYSSQALKENNMAQHVRMFNALSPSDKQGQDTIAADLSCEHARDIKQDV